MDERVTKRAAIEYTSIFFLQGSLVGSWDLEGPACRLFYSSAV